METADMADDVSVEALRGAVVALLSHALRCQHLPSGATFDSELWGRLREIGGPEAYSAVTEEIETWQTKLAAIARTEGKHGNG